MNKLDKQYQDLLQSILDYGVEKQDRTGTGTKSIFGYTIRHNMQDGFPVLTTKKMAWKTMVTELLWFLRGDTNIKFLVDNNCHIWDGDAYKNYENKISKKGQGFRYMKELSNGDLEKYTQEEFIDKIKTDDEFAEKFGELGPVYGKQWRDWNSTEAEFEGLAGIDQIQNLINDLKTNPDSRRLMVTAWNPSDLPNQVLPPCHYGFQVYTRELTFNERCEYAINEGWMSPFGALDFPETHYALDHAKTPKRAISLMWNQRSCDFPLGIPANIMSYALLLMMLSKQVNMVPEELIGNLGDCHIYLNQIDGVKEQLTREPLPLPNVILSDRVVNDLSEYIHTDIILENYQSHPKIYFPLSN